MTAVYKPKRNPKAPPHLNLATRKWWAQCVADYELEPHHVRLLTLAGEAWDRCREATERLRTDGAYVTDRFGCLKAHPAVAVERDGRVGFARLLRELDLDVEKPGDSKRPPLLSRYER